MANNYLPLTEYSSKHKVSISTLRRRIKADEIKYVFEDGKYLILDEPSTTSQKVHRPSQSSEQTVASEPRVQIEKTAVQAPTSQVAPVSPAREVKVGSAASMEWHPEIKNLGTNEGHEPILSAANQLLTQLKRAYTHVLQEKEEQILHLKEEISDLKTLVRVLESENERQRK